MPPLVHETARVDDDDGGGGSDEHGSARIVRAVDRWHRPLRLAAAAAAAVAAIAMFVALFVAEIQVGDEVTGAPRSATVWSAGLRIASGGSYGLILAVAAPAVLAATLLAGRWWRPTLLAVTVYSVHWLGHIAEYLRLGRELVTEFAPLPWQVCSHVALGVALVLGCVLLAASPAGRPDQQPMFREVVLVTSGLLLWALTWGRPQMSFEMSDLEREETFGLLHRLPLDDLDRIVELPLDHLVAYLPVVLVVVASLSMFLTGGRGRPDVRVGVWAGLAVGLLADVVQRLPVWYDTDPFGGSPGPGSPGGMATIVGTWSPSRASFLLLLAAAIAFVSAAWAAWITIEPTDDEDPLGPPLEVFDLDASPLWGERP